MPSLPSADAKGPGVTQATATRGNMFQMASVGTENGESAGAARPSTRGHDAVGCARLANGRPGDEALGRAPGRGGDACGEVAAGILG
jgi:hypothetical protein